MGSSSSKGEPLRSESSLSLRSSRPGSSVSVRSTRTKSALSVIDENEAGKSDCDDDKKVSGSSVSIKDRIEKARSTMSNKDLAKSTASIRASRASLRASKTSLRASVASLRDGELNKSRVSLKDDADLPADDLNKSTASLRSNGEEIKRWSDVEKSTLSLRSKVEEEEVVAEEKPKNIFDTDEEKLEGCEKVLESQLVF